MRYIKEIPLLLITVCLFACCSSMYSPQIERQEEEDSQMWINEKGDTVTFLSRGTVRINKTNGEKETYLPYESIGISPGKKAEYISHYPVKSVIFFDEETIRYTVTNKIYVVLKATAKMDAPNYMIVTDEKDKIKVIKIYKKQ